MTDIYQIITDKIIAQIEQGVSTYRMPWHSRQHGASELQLPRNVTGRTYRGVNVPVLWATASAFGYSSPIWATYKQWHERGAFYTPTGDFIQMPQFAQFVDAKSYYSVLAHEHTHWTGG